MTRSIATPPNTAPIPRAFRKHPDKVTKYDPKQDGTFQNVILQSDSPERVVPTPRRNPRRK